jgi:adenylosuccinate lyase
VVAEMEIFPAAVARERDRVAPFLATTTMLMEAVKRGAGREGAHAAIQEHALAAARQMQAGASGPDLLDRLAGDPRVGLGRDDLHAILANDKRFIGAALEQADAFLAEVDALVERVPEALAYRPDQIL